MLDLYIHDNLIAKSTALKLGVKAEMELSDYAVMSGADRNIVKKIYVMQGRYMLRIRRYQCVM